MRTFLLGGSIPRASKGLMMAYLFKLLAQFSKFIRLNQ
jgi:hypothetical protein